MSFPSTLPDLLRARAVSEHSAQLNFLQADGTVRKSISYADLYDIASVYARRLLAAGLKPSDIVLGGFTDHESQIYLFWACCLAGIPICLLPALHPDPSQQVNLFNHLQNLFHRPTLIASAEIVKEVHDIISDLKTLVPDNLPVPIPDTFNHVFPARRPSPDEIVCFALTSGSTGSSKAVLLQHSNFLSNLRGKVCFQGTTANSRLLNWISSDHVVCINEIHLHALALNASQWHISPVDISRNPLTLLKCLSKYRITYSFSPNFLLAAILRDLPNASFDEPLDLSKLRVLISGGEAVPVRTAAAFADMMEKFGARRNVIQGSFGMTETVAGITYDIRTTPKAQTPDGPKYLSVGKCCQGVEVRVVKHDTGKLCLPGEAGKLQIKGPTVFTEYYGNEDATAQSFTSDGWFTTGDLAQLDEDGNLYLVGRDKDFININGVKYPAQDVEHYIEDARIQGIMASYVCVCPIRLADADTETYGVFYQHEFVVEAGLESAQKDAIRATNRSIKVACTIFCSQAPHIILPLPRRYFAKTALGKVSHSQLSQAYLIGEFDNIRAMLETQDNIKRDDSDILINPVPGVVADIISTTFSVDMSSLRRSQNIFDMGATSMHLLRMKQAIQERLSIPKLPTMEMLKRTKVGELCDYLTELVAVEKRGVNEAAVRYDPIVCMNPSGSKSPLFLIHPGACEVLVFVALARQLEDDRPVYALRARGFENNEIPFNTWEEMIECYTSSIERVCPNGPYYIAGYSYGGFIAFEIVKFLESKDKNVPFLGIFNLPPYFQSFVPELNWAGVVFYLVHFLSIIPLSAISSMQKEMQKAFPELAVDGTKPLNPHGPISWLFERSDKKRLMDLDLDVNAVARWVNIIYEFRRIGRHVVPQGRVKNALMSVFCTEPFHVTGTRQEYKHDWLSVWKEFSGPRFEMIDVDGEHGTIVSEKNVVSFSAHLRAALHRAEFRE